MKIKRKYLHELLEFSVGLAKECEPVTMKYFTGRFRQWNKKDRSPVTEADVECEKHIIKRIMEVFPGHSILSEETGFAERKSDFKWIVDPIDGTKNFMRKIPFWGTLIALEHEGKVVMGVISMPAAGMLIYAAEGMGCYFNGKRSRVSSINNLSSSYCMHGGLNLMLRNDFFRNFLDVSSKCRQVRGFGDCHGHSFVIIGLAEIMVDPHVAPYDVAAVKICVEEAGGKLTDVKGNPTIYGGNAVVTNGKLHEKILKALNRKRPLTRN